MKERKKTVIDITAMAAWLGIDEESLLERLQVDDSDTDSAKENLAELKQLCEENTEHEKGSRYHWMAAAHFVRDIADIERQEIEGTSFP